MAATRAEITPHKKIATRTSETAATFTASFPRTSTVATFGSGQPHPAINDDLSSPCRRTSSRDVIHGTVFRTLIL
jgi:hypothetical protein